jgi:ketol-acid reductoisomerase
MVTGFNTNIEYQGAVYHVQTEHEGSGYPIITTILFQEGVALMSRKTSYLSCSRATSLEQAITEWMKAQHKTVLKELVSGNIPLPMKTPVTTAVADEGAI